MELDDSDKDFEKWYLETRGLLMGIAFVYLGNLEEARDLTQETFARAWQHWDRVSNYANKDAWARRVLHNLAVSKWRRRRLERTRVELPRELVEPPSADHLDLIKLTACLPAKQRRAFILHEVVDLSVEDVAREMGVPAGTVRSWLHRARTSLASEDPPAIRPAAERG
jgi:RNA polymerase sigma-70 factor (ECF subfamily)